MTKASHTSNLGAQTDQNAALPEFRGGVGKSVISVIRAITHMESLVQQWFERSAQSNFFVIQRNQITKLEVTQSIS